MANKGLGKKDSALVVSLAMGRSIAQAAKDCGISPRTVVRRKSDPDFAKLVAEARNETFAQARGQLAELATEAIDALRDLLKSKRPAVRLRAAQSVLRFGRVRESELEARLTLLESGGKPSGS